MGFAEKAQVVDGGFETEGKKWVIAGITTRGPLRQIRTKRIEKEVFDSEEVCDQEESCSTTPTAKEAKIPEKLPCPPAPRKRRSSSRCNFNGVREFFNPPDLESVFIRHVERAK